MRNAIKIETNIALGRVPDSDDIVQLKDLGYKTLVDVREDEEIFGGRVEQRAKEIGLRYINIPISRADIKLKDVIHFYSVIYDRSNAPLYVFSRFGKKPLAFIVLLEAVANGEPLVKVYRRASKIGIDLLGDLCLQSFLVDFFNKGCEEEIISAIRKFRPDLLKGLDEKNAQDENEVASGHLEETCMRRQGGAQISQHRGCTIWLTGLPSCGKSTVAYGLENELAKMGFYVYVLDSSNIRRGLNNDLGYSSEDRKENIRRTSQIAKMFSESGVIVVTSFISPYREDRRLAREIHRKAGLGFVEVFLDTPIEICEKRDRRGLYEKARKGELADFTGVDGVYESPSNSEIVVKPAEERIEAIVSQIISYLEKNDHLVFAKKQ
jgi:adenylylsulfate kinase